MSSFSSGSYVRIGGMLVMPWQERGVVDSEHVPAKDFSGFKVVPGTIFKWY